LLLWARRRAGYISRLLWQRRANVKVITINSTAFATAGLLLWARRAGDVGRLLQQWRANRTVITINSTVVTTETRRGALNSSHVMRKLGKLWRESFFELPPPQLL